VISDDEELFESVPKYGDESLENEDLKLNVNSCIQDDKSA
jgi:hypothetical protein